MKPSILIAHNLYQQRGGEDQVVDSESALLRKHGHEVTLFKEDNASISDIPKYRLAIETVWSSKAMRRISSAIERSQPDIIHIHNTLPLMSPSIYWAAANHGIPVVQTLHNFRLLCPQAMLLRDGKICEDCIGHLPWRGIVHKCYRDSALQTAVVTSMLGFHRLIKTYKDKVSAYIALTEFSKNKFIEGGFPAERIHVKPNFVDIHPAEFYPRKNGLYVGRLSPEKGIACLASSVRGMPNIMIDVYGSGSMTSIMQSISQFRLHGWKSSTEINEAMQKAAYLIVPSIWYETFGLIVIEAFANGLPVIASRIGALSELVDDGRTGLLFQPGSHKSLAELIAWAERHPDKMANMGKNAKSEYEEKYSPKSNYEQLLGIYQHVLN